MMAQVDAHCSKRIEVEFLNVLRRRLQYDLQLHALVQAVGILAVAPVRRPARGLNVGHFVWVWPEHTQKGFGRHSAGANFDIVGLLQHTSAFRPEGLQMQDEALEGERVGKRRGQFLKPILQHLAFSTQHSVAAGPGYSRTNSC